MRKSFGAKPMLYPMPVLIIGSYDEKSNPNAMNAAWGGISEETEISICVSDEHKTTENILKTKAFTVSVADVDNVIAADYVGIISGNKNAVKIKKAGWTVTKSEFVNAPLFNELPFSLECKLISYDKDTCRLVGEIAKPFPFLSFKLNISFPKAVHLPDFSNVSCETRSGNLTSLEFALSIPLLI